LGQGKILPLPVQMGLLGVMGNYVMACTNKGIGTKINQKTKTYSSIALRAFNKSRKSALVCLKNLFLASF
jgi:hypothetical protein